MQAGYPAQQGYPVQQVGVPVAGYPGVAVGVGYPGVIYDKHYDKHCKKEQKKALKKELKHLKKMFD